MPVRPSTLALALALALAVDAAQAQSLLPRRDNVERALEGTVERDARRDRHVLASDARRPVLAPIDGGRVLDFDAVDGSPPEVWSSQGGALLVRHALHPVDADTWSVDTHGRGARWLRLESDAPARTIVHTRVDPVLPGTDPWLVPLAPEARPAARTRPGRRDHVLRLDADYTRYRVDGGPIRLDVWRTQSPRLAPAEATWLRVEADGHVMFDGRAPTPVEPERLHATDGCADVLELAGRLRVDLPPRTREVRVQGEPGTWLKVLSPLPGTPAEALAVDADPAREHFLVGAGESIEAAFDRAVRAFPDPRAQAFLARYGYFRPVAIAPVDGVLQSRSWRARHVDRDVRRTFETQRPVPGETPVTATTFHFLPAGARWRLDTAVPPPRAGLLRISVAHADSTLPAPHLRLEQSGQPAVDLRLDPALVRAMRDASSEADALLALDPDGAPVVDASQALLLRMAPAAPAFLANTGTQGAWVAVEHRVPAPRPLDVRALVATQAAVEALQDALLADVDDAGDAAGTPATTRAVQQARRLLASRVDRFAADPCMRDAGAGPAAAARALDVLARADGVDPLVARCAAQQAIASSPRAAPVQAAFEAWALRAEQHELLTGALAHFLRAPDRRRDRAAWRRLADALQAEGEHAAATLAARAAGDASPPVPDAADAPTAELSAGAVRLATERGTEVAVARAEPARPARWRFDRAGVHVLELRNMADRPQWVRLRSAGRTWSTRLPAADAATTTLRAIGSGAAPGLSLRIPLSVHAAGAVVEVEPVAGAVLGRLEAPADAAPRADAPHSSAHRHAFDMRVADQCRVEYLRGHLAVHTPAAPIEAGAPGVAAVPTPDAPVVGDGHAIGDATQAALFALQRIEAHDLDAARAAAARAYALRESTVRAPAAGVFPELDRHVAWRRVKPEAHGGLRERLVADGRSTNPLVARRERWAGLDDDAPFVLRAGQDWVLEGLQPGQAVRLTLRAQAALQGRVAVRTTRGARHVLDAGASRTVDDTADSAGALQLRVGEALPATFVTLEVADASGRPLDGRRPVAYHRGPVTLRLSAPTVLRIVEWDGDTADVRMQHVPSAGDVVLRAQRAGGALRVSALELEPAAPRPDTTDDHAGTADAAAAPAARDAWPVTAPPGALPSPAPAPWPDARPDSGGEDGTWGVQVAWQQRVDTDDPDDRRERFGEARWRWRWTSPAANLWGRIDVVGRAHDDGARVFGFQHDLQWRQPHSPWGATLDAAAWWQAAQAGLAPSARATSVRAAVDWSRRRDERWRDDWELGLRWRTQSREGVPRQAAARLDNDVYSRYRERHLRQADLGYRLTWRARYDSEWTAGAQAVTNELPDARLDQAGAHLGWRWARYGWTASATLDARHYFRDAHRAAARTRERAEVAIGRLWLGADDGWRLRVAVGYDGDARQPHGGLVLEWFDHDGRGLEDFAPSELFLRGVTETDLARDLQRGETAP